VRVALRIHCYFIMPCTMAEHTPDLEAMAVAGRLRRASWFRMAVPGRFSQGIALLPIVNAEMTTLEERVSQCSSVDQERRREHKVVDFAVRQVARKENLQRRKEVGQEHG
jgi:hypothetical protein